MKRTNASSGEIEDDGVGSIDTTHLQVKIYSPFKVYYSDIADSVTAENDTGVFDVLPGHKNFLSLLNSCDLLIRNGEKEETISITRGIIHVHSNDVKIFLDV